MYVELPYIYIYMCRRNYNEFHVYVPGIFLENILKYQNNRSDKLGGAILAQQGGFLKKNLIHVYYRTFSVREWPLVVGFKGPFQILGG